ncbi:NAD(P)H-hydrate dehydratase [Candidatus Roizmanbacteria bacterium]|nr:NAD(P)H-hydrate dehydratase [Candidatus Roizmanbacteria bacterium]
MTTIINTSNGKAVRAFLKYIHIPKPNSHKGQNGKALVIGGSSLFHSASIWAAEIASHLVDMVHYSSTQENNEIFLSLKKKFRNGMVVRQEELLEYVKEDDVILVGPGMMRGKITNDKLQMTNFKDILKTQDEPTYTYHLTKYLLEHFPDKKFVIDAGALQVIKPEWLLRRKVKTIITPHQGEFKKLFNIDLSDKNDQQKSEIVAEYAKKFDCLILLKAIKDFISDGAEGAVVEGGNSGLTKGGTGDILAGLTASFYAKSGPFESAILSSFLLKRTADELFLKKGYWYNISDIIESLPSILNTIIFKR